MITYWNMCQAGAKDPHRQGKDRPNLMTQDNQDKKIQ